MRTARTCWTPGCRKKSECYDKLLYCSTVHTDRLQLTSKPDNQSHIRVELPGCDIKLVPPDLHHHFQGLCHHSSAIRVLPRLQGESHGRC